MGTILLVLLAAIVLGAAAFVVGACVVAGRADDEMERMMAARAKGRVR